MRPFRAEVGRASVRLGGPWPSLTLAAAGPPLWTWQVPLELADALVAALDQVAAHPAFAPWRGDDAEAESAYDVEGDGVDSILTFKGPGEFRRGSDQGEYPTVEIDFRHLRWLRAAVLFAAGPIAWIMLAEAAGEVGEIWEK